MEIRTESSWHIWLISPFACSTLSIAVFWVAFFFPPFTFTRLTHDENYAYFNWNSALFTSLSIVAMVVGWFTYTFIFSSKRSQLSLPAKYASSIQSPVTLAEMIVTAILTGCNLTLLYLMYKSGAVSQFAAVSQGTIHAGEYHNEVIDLLGQTNLGSMLLVSSLVLPWLYWLKLESTRMNSPKGVLLSSVLFWMLLASYMITLLLIGKRNMILRPIIGVFFVWYMNQLQFKKTNTTKLISGLLILGCGFLLVVTGLELVRTGIFSGNWNPDNLLTKFVGYFVSPYNQQAAMLEGNLTFPGEGKGYYWTQWLWRFPVLQHFLDAPNLLGEIPPYGVVERTEILSLNGFEPHFTALPIFAHSYVDFGWMGPFAFVAYGFAGAFFWNRFLMAKLDGIIFYGMFAYSVLDWRGNMYFPSNATGQALIIYFALATGRISLYIASRKEQRLHSHSNFTHQRY